MKIGIVTVYRNINYGSKLQSYALQYTLKKLGATNTENLLVHKDTQPLPQKKSLICNFYNRISLMIKKPQLIYDKLFNRIVTKNIKYRHNIFDYYLNESIAESPFSPSEITNRIDKGIKDYDYFICGSDQIWAPNQFNEAYFLSFVKNKDIKISYATSIGLPAIPENLKPKYKRLISSIDHLSIREKDGADLIKEITDIENIPVVLDPTLLLTREEWLEHAIEYPINGNYILCLFLGNNIKHRKWVERYSKKLNYKIITLPMKKHDAKFGDEQCYDAGPKEFLGLLSKASVICTDSYHGMLFSINFNKNFFSFLRFSDNDPLNQNSRVLNFLSSLNLTDRIIDTEKVFAEQLLKSPINWKKVNKMIAKKRQDSIEFLKQSLNV